MREKIAFIGVGNMASAIIAGITSAQNSLVRTSDVILHNRHREKIEKYALDGMYIADSLTDAVTKADCVVLCIKPQSFPDILPCLSLIPDVNKKLFITIAAGITSQTVSDAANGAAVVRAMPNTPMLIGQGVSALCRNGAVTDEDFHFACDIFKSSGNVIVIDEDEMNRIICVTGSSPAYVFMLIKAMYDGACAQGLLKNEESGSGLTSKELIDCICDTIMGAAQLMKNGTKTPEEQIQTVCSKGGTTERAVAHFKACEFERMVVDAMQKCTDRADELANNK